MDIQTFLKQSGFNVKILNKQESISGFYNLDSFHQRIQVKKNIKDKYPHFFEIYIKELLRNKYGFIADNNIQFKNEGNGGDYDVLALDGMDELYYFECKTGNNIDKLDIENYLKRHKFLKPNFSMMVIDQNKHFVNSILEIMRKVLTEQSKKNDKHLEKIQDYIYPKWRVIPDTKHEYAYHTYRNLFFCSGEDIPRAISHCLRYYRGVVKQSSYWG